MLSWQQTRYKELTFLRMATDYNMNDDDLNMLDISLYG